MYVLVIGGVGFIGSHLVMRLLKEEHDITIVDYDTGLFDQKSKNKLHIYQLGAEDGGCERIIAATCFDLVYHLGFYIPTNEINDQELSHLHTNHAGLSNILYLAQKYHIPRVIVLSSYHVYGRQEEKLIKEDAQLRPYENIGYQFRTRESLCNEYRQRGMNITILRAGCVYGPRNKPGPANFIQKVIDDLLSSWQTAERTAEQANLSGSSFDPTAYDYIYISDVVEALNLAATRETSPVLNLSSGKGVTKSDIESVCQQLFAKRTSDKGLAGDYTDEAISEIISPDRDPSQLSGAPSIILDNSRARSELSWEPKINIKEGLRKTFEWSFRNSNEVAINEAVTTQVTTHKFSLSIQQRRILVTLSLGLLAILMTWLVQYQIDISLDFLLLYVMAASLYFGIRQGVLAIMVAAVSRVVFQLAVDKISLATLINDSDLMMLLTLYLILGVCIGYTIDHKFHQNENIKNDLNKTKRELQFVNILYQKSLEVKNNLQLSIENSADSLGKLIHLISRMNHVKADQLYNEVAAIYADLLQARDVQVFSTDAAGLWLRQMATVGNAKFGKSITADQFGFLNTVYQERSIYINHDLNPRYPMICAPIYIGRQIDAIVFIDGVEFIRMNQQFVNTLKALTILVSESVENKYRQIEDLEAEKYFSNTILMKQKWFKKAIQDKITSNKQKAVLVKIGEKILNYRKFNRVVSNLVRSTDLVGELSQGQLGIIFIDTDQRYLSIIKERFTEKGYTIEKISESGGEENAGVHAGSQRTGHSGRLSSL